MVLVLPVASLQAHAAVRGLGVVLPVGVLTLAVLAGEDTGLCVSLVRCDG